MLSETFGFYSRLYLGFFSRDSRDIGNHRIRVFLANSITLVPRASNARSYETRFSGETPSPLSDAQTRNTVLTRLERYTSIGGGQCHIEIRLFAITRFCVFARIIPRPAVIESNHETFSSQIVRSRETRRARVFPLRNAADNDFNRYVKFVEEEEEDDTRSLDPIKDSRR